MPQALKLSAIQADDKASSSAHELWDSHHDHLLPWDNSRVLTVWK